MIVLPLLLAWLGPYFAYHIPGYETTRGMVSILSDFLFVTRLFVLGGEFWDKIRALFIIDVKVLITANSLSDPYVH